MVNTKCQDPEWQRDVGVNTFYPHATTCFEDPSHGRRLGVRSGLISSNISSLQPPVLTSDPLDQVW